VKLKTLQLARRSHFAILSQPKILVAERNLHGLLMHRIVPGIREADLRAKRRVNHGQAPLRRRRKLNAGLIVSLKTASTSAYRSTPQELRVELQKRSRSD